MQALRFAQGRQTDGTTTDRGADFSNATETTSSRAERNRFGWPRWVAPCGFPRSEAKSRLSELVQRAARGEEIIIARNGRFRRAPTAERPRRIRGRRCLKPLFT
ncbi:MAG: type II toxin-antitoxin system prevent-host-death family antitoxin [Gemmatimonadota bacterium]